MCSTDWASSQLATHNRHPVGNQRITGSSWLLQNHRLTPADTSCRRIWVRWDAATMAAGHLRNGGVVMADGYLRQCASGQQQSAASRQLAAAGNKCTQAAASSSRQQQAAAGISRHQKGSCRRQQAAGNKRLPARAPREVPGGPGDNQRPTQQPASNSQPTVSKQQAAHNQPPANRNQLSASSSHPTNISQPTESCSGCQAELLLQLLICCYTELIKSHGARWINICCCYYSTGSSTSALPSPMLLLAKFVPTTLLLLC